MASNPPFQVEDQTDEDFFDKLVDDDDEYKVTAPPGHSLVDSDSDEVKAFANLSIGEVTAGEDSGGEGGYEANKEATVENVSTVTEDGHVEESGSLESCNSRRFDNVIESNGIPVGAEGTSDLTFNKSDRSANSGVKEVQWTAFNSDLGQNDSNGFGSYSDFFSELGDGVVDPTGKVENSVNSEPKIPSGSEVLETTCNDNNYNYMQYQDSQAYDATMGHNADLHDLNCSQNWENLYPGWKYDYNTGQWYQVDGNDTTENFQGSIESNYTGDLAVSDGNSQVSYLQQTAQTFVGTVTENGTTETVTNWNQLSDKSGVTDNASSWNQLSQESGGAEGVSQGNYEYPSHMVFDPQYPGWYYDTIVQEWRSLDNYAPSVQASTQAYDQLGQKFSASSDTLSQHDHEKSYGDHGQVQNYSSQGFGAQSQDYHFSGSFGNYNQQNSGMWHPEAVTKSETSSDLNGNQQSEGYYGSNLSACSHISEQKSYVPTGTVSFYQKPAQVHSDHTTVSQGFVPSNFTQKVERPSMQQNEPMHVSNDYYTNLNSVKFSQQPLQSSHQFSYAPNAGWQSAGRPLHALVTFGFGGKLVVMKDHSLSSSSYGSQGPIGGSISVLNLMDVITEKTESLSMGMGAFDYFNTLCGQSFPGPLVGGNVGSKELNKWVEERIANCESPDMNFRKGKVLKLLISLLKIACQYYGKLRSPFGSDSALRESDVPESAVAKLFASAKKNGGQFSDYGDLAHCLQQLPSEGQIQATAAQVQSLLVSGRKKEALHCASEGQLWGPALVLAAQLGDQFYSETVKQMALHQLVAGSPLRTLCLLIAGQPAEVFSMDTSERSISGGLNMSLQPAQCGANGMLDDWEENLALITANRTKDDELVLIHLGDCLWKDRSEVIAAHICYLVAEANFEPYSDTARLCLIGADHWKCPRTYASPSAIQRTELYEYSKVLGNSQFVLLPFQPYKLIYAHMLAEVGKITESLKYCQAVLKSLKTGRAPEVETWRQLVSSLEERIRTHQQGGYSTNLAPAKLVGKLLNLFDTTAQRVVGGPPTPVPSTTQGAAQATEHHYHTMGPRVSSSQSTMAMSSLMPSAAMEPRSEWTGDGNRMTMHNRSISEPDFGRTPRQDQVNSSAEATSTSAQGKASRFGRFSFGSQLLQKTVGLVLKPRQDREAKLGEKNRFYYDEKLKRWVEEGADPPAEEASLPPPPTTSAFQNGTLDYNLKSALTSDSSPSNGSPKFTSPTMLDQGSGIPPMPPASNQFSARGRMGVRSRYVDTFNKGGGNPTNLFQSPSVPSVRPATVANPKFFVPTPESSSELGFGTVTNNAQETVATADDFSTLITNDSFHSPPPSSSIAMQRFPSMDNISNKETATNDKGSLSSHSRRTASWSGSFSNAYSPPQRAEAKPPGKALGMQPSAFMPNGPSIAHMPIHGGSSSDDLQEVEL